MASLTPSNRFGRAESTRSKQRVKHRALRALSAVFALGALSVAPAHAADSAGPSYYVDCSAGSDSNSGTAEASPWRSLSAINGRAFTPGAAIHFKRDCRWTGALQVKSIGTATAPVRYTAYGAGSRPTISNSALYGASIDVYGDYNVIEGLLVRDSHEAGVRVRSGADRNIVRDVEATAVGMGIYVGGQYNQLTRNYVHDLKMIVNTSGGDDDYGAVCFWLSAHNNEVSYNRGINCKAASYDYGLDGGFVEVWQNGDNSNIHHNYAENTDGFFELGGRTGSARNIKSTYNVLNNANGLCPHIGDGGQFDGITINNFRFDNNTVVRTNGGRYSFLECVNNLTPSLLTMRNNVFYTDKAISRVSGFGHVNNLYHLTNGAQVGFALGSGEKVGDPKFTNVAGKDFRLQSTSPAINAGLTLGYLKDFDDRSVPSGSAPDMGAFEYGATVPTTDTGSGTAPAPDPTSSTVSLNDNSIGSNVNQFSYSGTWNYATGSGRYNGDDHYTNVSGSVYRVQFRGTRAKLYVATAPWHGKAAVSIDGGPETVIDLYSSGKADQVLRYTSPNLATGTHTLKVRATGTRNTSSTGTYITADRVDVSG